MIEANLTNKKETTVTGLFQWDYGQIVKVIGINETDNLEIHIGNDSSETYMVKSIAIGNGYFTFQIPDSLLQASKTIKAIIYYDSGTEGKSKKVINFQVRARTKPEDYITPDDENYKYVVPKGGTTGQVLVKKSDADGDTGWANQTGTGSSNYTDLSNKPSINGVTLSGNKTSSDIGVASSDHTHSEYLEEPSSEGTSGQVLMTDGNGGRSWGSVSGSGSSVTVDTTLTQSGKAADAKVTGDVITVIKNILQKATFTEDVSSLFTQLENLLSGSSEANITQSGSVLTVISGVTVSQSGTVLTLS